jgi:hypothetical protein
MTVGLSTAMNPSDPHPSADGALDDTLPEPIDTSATARSPASRWRWLRLLLVALLVVAPFALEEVVFSSPPLSFSVGAEAEAGVLRDWESAPDDRPLALRFSDGTIVELDPGARARVLALGRAGAHLVVESGTAHVRAREPRLKVPGEDPWRVSVGPFTAEATSGHFDVSWDPRTDAVALDVAAGSVALGGCDRAQAETVGPGQGVRASCAARQWARVAAGAPPTLP